MTAPKTAVPTNTTGIEAIADQWMLPEESTA